MPSATVEFVTCGLNLSHVVIIIITSMNTQISLFKKSWHLSRKKEFASLLQL